MITSVEGKALDRVVLQKMNRTSAGLVRFGYRERFLAVAILHF